MRIEVSVPFFLTNRGSKVEVFGTPAEKTSREAATVMNPVGLADAGWAWPTMILSGSGHVSAAGQQTEAGLDHGVSSWLEL